MDRPCSDVQCKAAGYPLHSHLSPELPLPHVTVCHQVPNGLYLRSLLFRAGIKSLPPPATLMAVWPFKGLTVRHIYIYMSFGAKGLCSALRHNCASFSMAKMSSYMQFHRFRFFKLCRKRLWICYL